MLFNQVLFWLQIRWRGSQRQQVPPTGGRQPAGQRALRQVTINSVVIRPSAGGSGSRGRRVAECWWREEGKIQFLRKRKLIENPISKTRASYVPFYWRSRSSSLKANLFVKNFPLKYFSLPTITAGEGAFPARRSAVLYVHVCPVAGEKKLTSC